MPKRAFTLIELLIVVAIIAILAAIAVPNFLEAQTRAKVSRARADMRSVATGIEAYATDSNHYPPPVAYLGSGPYTMEDPSQDEYQAFVPPRLTTPVAYMTSLPADPFRIKIHGEHPPYACYHYSEQENNAQMEEPRPTFIVERVRTIGAAGAAGNCRYFLASHGPDLADPNEDAAVLYDPTNGTVSDGDIYYLGPGIGQK